MFENQSVPPIILVGFQQQKRIQGDFKLNATKLEWPGGLKVDGQPNLKNLEFLIDGVAINRYYSTYQGNIE